MPVHPNSLKNLKVPTHEEAVANGKKSGEIRREKALMRKTLRDNFNALLSKPLKKGKMVTPEEIQDMANLDDLNIDVQTAMQLAIIQRALLGDVQAITFIRDTVGEKPSDKVEVDQSLTIENWVKNHKVKL